MNDQLQEIQQSIYEMGDGTIIKEIQNAIFLGVFMEGEINGGIFLFKNHNSQLRGYGIIPKAAPALQIVNLMFVENTHVYRLAWLSKRGFSSANDTKSSFNWFKFRSLFSTLTDNPDFLKGWPFFVSLKPLLVLSIRPRASFQCLGSNFFRGGDNVGKK